ncbi:uncharacterized protein LOC135081015 [Ostrinia nubilalis]|uniref:uncharacterized protein LOC135081015 n=1 Tax=Ostrinia nubilalis TaxID=29057 RepID=UPI0030825480
MAVIVLWISMILAANSVHSYILLTANLEDVQSIAKQMVDSPLGDQIRKIWRRASHQFNQQMARSRLHQRAEEDKDYSAEENPAQMDENSVRNEEDMQNQEAAADDRSGEPLVERRHGDDVAELAKNASRYLTSMQDMMKNL